MWRASPSPLPSNVILVSSRLHPARLSDYRTMSLKPARGSPMRAATGAYSGGAQKCTLSWATNRD
jgi:hypothetical protein